MNSPLTEQQRSELIRAAQKAQAMAYVKYSEYKVGAALLTESGDIITGCNIENASYGGTICAERTAMVKAVSEGQRKFLAIAVVTDNGGYPCGLCRQFMYEFAPDLLVIVADAEGKVRGEMRLRDLLPHGFGPEELYASP